MAKKNTLVWFGVAAVLVWYYMRNKKKSANNNNLSAGSSQVQTAIENAGTIAKTMVADVVDNTTFIPDEKVTSRKLYSQDKKSCNV